MAISRGFIILVIAIAVSCTLATPIKRSKVKLARQIESTTPSSVVEQRTGYPEAGFRPEIPFELPNKKPQSVTESVELLTTTPESESALEDLDKIVPTTAKAEVEDRTPADTYGPPLSTDDTEEIEGEVVSAPAEDFQPPSDEPIQDFSSTFDLTNNNDIDVIADLPTVEQTSKADDVNVIGNELPEIKSSEPKTDVEEVDQEQLAEIDDDVIVSEDEQQEQNFEFDVIGEGSAESEIHEPADTYGAPKTELDETNEIESELAEVEQELEILSRLTRTKNGRLIILPIDNNLYFGRLVSSQTKRAQRKNGRLLKL